MVEWITDKTYYKSKYNTAKIDLKVNRDAYTRSITELARQLEEKESELQYWKKSSDLRNKDLKKVKEENKMLKSELEKYGKKRKKI